MCDQLRIAWKDLQSLTVRGSILIPETNFVAAPGIFMGWALFALGENIVCFAKKLVVNRTPFI